MGWTFTVKHFGETIDDFFDREVQWERLHFVGKGCVKNFREYYRAMYDTKEKRYCAFVALIDTKERSDGYNMGYKEMSESMGPYICNCPERIMNIIERSEPENDCAKNWREKCWAVINRQKQGNKLDFGSVIKFAKPIMFGNGKKEDEFIVVKKEWNEYGGKTKRATKVLKSKNYGFMCKLPGWKNMNWSVVE